jgi:hypothetical protein
LQGYIIHQVKFQNNDIVYDDEEKQTMDFTYRKISKMHEAFNVLRGHNDCPLPSPDIGNQTPLQPFTPHTPLPDARTPYSIPIPSALKMYTLLYPINNKIVRFRITERIVTTPGIHKWRLSPIDDGYDDLMIDNEDFHKLVKNSHDKIQQKPPTKNIPTLHAHSNFSPSPSQGWSNVQAGLVGMKALVYLTPSSAPITQQKLGRRSKKFTFSVVIEAALVNAISGKAQLWGRLTVDPSRSVIFTSINEAVDAVHAQEVMDKYNYKSKSSRRYHNPATSLLHTLDDLSPTDGDFAIGATSTSTWKNSLDSFKSILPNSSYKVLKAGVQISNLNLKPHTISRVRRLYSEVLEHRNKHEIMPLLIELFWGMILAPFIGDSSEDFDQVVKHRCEKFQSGDWTFLYNQVIYRTLKEHEPSHPNTNTDP